LRPGLFGGSGLEVLRVSYIIALPTGGASDAQNVSIDTASGKDNNQQNLLKKMMMRYCRVYSQIASDV